MSEQKQATPAEELRRQFMHHSTPLTEAGHWARQHIEELEEIIEFQEGVRKLDNAEFGKLRRAKEALQAELDQEQRKAGQEMIERLALVEKVQQLEAERDEAVSAVQRLSSRQPFEAVVIADSVKRRTAQLEAELRTLDNVEATHRITLRGVQAETMRLQTKCDKLEAENKRLREALEAVQADKEDAWILVESAPAATEQKP